MTQTKEIRIQTSYTRSAIEQARFSIGEDNSITELSRRIVKMEEDGVREALEKIGWSTPEKTYSMKKEIEFLTSLIDDLEKRLGC